MVVPQGSNYIIWQTKSKMATQTLRQPLSLYCKKNHKRRCRLQGHGHIQPLYAVNERGQALIFTQAINHELHLFVTRFGAFVCIFTFLCLLLVCVSFEQGHLFLFFATLPFSYFLLPVYDCTHQNRSAGAADAARSRAILVYVSSHSSLGINPMS